MPGRKLMVASRRCYDRYYDVRIIEVTTQLTVREGEEPLDNWTVRTGWSRAANGLIDGVGRNRGSPLFRGGWYRFGEIAKLPGGYSYRLETLVSSHDLEQRENFGRLARAADYIPAAVSSRRNAVGRD